ncbi:hypothetical protein NHH03_05560 [Stieleria sp. TO1_6]|uniref:hypothetical protein n=1 Tax=Stieleria tagensis TaxID=2956795 RepID=UPI00209A9AFC|nr:hypothetical protein [Stieleria tagensis]MCO8121196.1 hypothetical protein [Stieleria tagensis]
MKHFVVVGLVCVLCSVWVVAEQPQQQNHAGISEQQLIAIRDGYHERVSDLFRPQQGKPLVRGKIHRSNGGERPDGVGRFAYSLTEHAAVNLWHHQDIDSANVALAEYGTFFIEHPETIYDRDNFHWHSEAALRLIDFFGRHGTKEPGLITVETEDKVMEAVWLYCKRRQQDQTRYNTKSEADTDLSQTWYIYESENHHAQSFCTLWHFAKLAKELPGFQDRKYDDGRNADAHHAAWNEYLKTYFAERAKKGMFIEMMSRDYNQKSLKGMFNIYDFAGDKELRRRCGLFIDLYFAYWGQEQIDGISGGGKSRIYSDISPSASEFGYLFFGVGEEPRFNSTLISSMTTGYRPPLVVVDIVCDVQGRGVYEVLQRPLGLAASGFYEPPIYHVRTDVGGIVRYSYCTPEFIVGTAMYEARPREDWTLISSQNRSRGVVFAGNPVAGIYPRCETDNNNRAYNTNWSVQRKGTMICQKLKANQRGGRMRVWVGADGLSEPVEENGWWFTESEGAYAAIRIVTGGYHWEDPERRSKGRWLYCDDEYSPVILEVGQKSHFQSFDDFRSKVNGTSMKFSDSLLHYTGLYGDRFSFYTDYSKAPTINDVPVDYAPPNAFESPFLNAVWNSGVVQIQKGARKRTLDFNGE